MTRIIRSHYTLLNGLLRMMQRLMFRPVLKGDKGKIKKIVIFRNGSFGDIICALPAILSIKNSFPDSEVDIMTNSGGESLVSAENIIDKSLVNSFINYLEMDRRDLIKLIRQNDYNLLIELPQDQTPFWAQLRNIIVVRYLFRIRRAFGWEIGATRFFKKHQEKYYPFKDERTRLLAILQRANLITETGQYALNIQPEDERLVQEVLKKDGILDINRNIALVVGAKRPCNRWPMAYFEKVAKYYSDKGFNILIVGGPEDEALAKPLLAIAHVHSYAGKLTPMQSGVLLKNCSMTISNDTGPMHLSYAVGTPVVAMFSSRDYPNKWFPPVGNPVLRNDDIDCSVCFTETCSDNRCMKGILPEEVLAKAEDLLKKLGNKHE